MMNLNGERGFTLIELMIVIAIIGILAVVAIPQLTGVRSQANVAAAKSELKNIQTQLELNYTKNGSYPTLGTDEEITAIDEISEGLGTAPNGPYEYTGGGQNYTVKWDNPDADGDDLQVTPDGGLTIVTSSE